MLAFRICSAVSGDSFTVRMDIKNFKISVFKSSLSTFSGIAPNDQILLIGPPYKVLDSHFNPHMCANGQKIFMFDKRIISEVGAVPPVVKLKPYSVPEPSLIDIPMSSCLAESSSPMLRAVPDYETQFLSHLRQGEAFLSAVEQGSASCKRCLEQIEAQKMSLEAAISNLNDHYTSTKVSFESKQQKIVVQQQAHKNLLNNFDDNFQQLSAITLHSSLQILLSTYSNFSESGDSGNTNSQLLSLRDTIPVDKEFAWREKCSQSHQKVEENMAQLQLIFDGIALSMDKLSLQTEPPHSLEELTDLATSLESSVAQQKSRMDELRESYSAAAEEISQLLQCEEGQREGKITELFLQLEASRKQQELAIKPMEECCKEAMRVKELFAETKTSLCQEIYRTLRGIASIQTDIQFKLKKGMELMTRWRQGHNGYFQHLERIRSLPEAYATFLHEMIRREGYTQEFENIVKSSVDSISAFRAAETAQRELFMANMGSCLPPIFFDIVPSLVEKPPFFNATITERQDIPHIQIEEVRDILEPFGLLEAEDERKEKRDSDINFDENNDSGATLTSSSDESADDTSDLSKEVKEGEECKTINALEEKLARLEEENTQLRRLAALNLRSHLPAGTEALSGSLLAEKCSEALAEEGAGMGGQGLEHQREERENIDSAEDVLNESLDLELVALLLDVLELKNSIGRGLSLPLPSQADSTEVAALTESQLSEVAELVQGIHSLSLCVKEDAHRLKVARATRGGSAPSAPRISFLQLKVGDIALFLSTNKQDTYLAFTRKQPHYYLSQDSLANFKDEKGENPSYILGQIIFIDERIASRGVTSDVGSVKAPKNLPPGMRYYLLEIVAVDFPSPN